MPSALIAALAAPIREVAAQVGPGWSDEGDPTVALAEVRDLLADVVRGGAQRLEPDRRRVVGSGSRRRGRLRDGDRTRGRRSWRCGSTSCVRAPPTRRMRWHGPASRLKDIINRFEDRAAALEPRLDEPWAVDELRAEAQRALDEAVAVVDELRTELDGHAAAVAVPTTGRGNGGRSLAAGGVHVTGRIHCGSGRLANGLGRRSPRRERRIHGAG